MTFFFLEVNLIWFSSLSSSLKSGVALVLCQSDPVLNDGQNGSDPSRKTVIDGVRRSFIEKVVAEHEDDDDGSSSD